MLNDISRICNVLSANDWSINPELAYSVWKFYSGHHFSEWVTLPENDDELIKTFVDWTIKMAISLQPQPPIENMIDDTPDGINDIFCMCCGSENVVKTMFGNEISYRCLDC